MEQKNIGFIGAGNMGSSLIGGLIRDHYPAERIWASSHDDNVLKQLESQFGIHTCKQNLELAQQVDIIIMCVKPQIISIVTQELSAVLKNKNILLISVAAGVRVKDIEAWANTENPVIRCMPNTPALVNSGISGLYANEHVNDAGKEIAESILRAVGATVWLDSEEQLDLVTALSGSGPAYFFLIMEALRDAAMDHGMPGETANLLTMQTCLGAVHMALQSDHDLATLRQQVTSPGGTTEKALQVLESGDLRILLSNALTAAKNRAKELGDDLGEKT